jgi:hypothetical protein
MTATICAVETCDNELRHEELASRWQICRPCVHQLRAWFRAIPNLLIVLTEGSMHRERTGESGGRGGPKEAPLPGRPATMTFIGPACTTDVHDPHGDQGGIRPMIGTLGDWTQHLLDERPQVAPPRVWTETVLAEWLTGMLPWAAQQDFIGPMYTEIRDMIYTGLSIARIDIRTRAVSRPCPACQMMSLARQDWDLYTRCSNCGNSYTQSELNDDAPRQLEALAEERTAA